MVLSLSVRSCVMKNCQEKGNGLDFSSKKCLEVYLPLSENSGEIPSVVLLEQLEQRYFTVTGYFDSARK